MKSKTKQKRFKKCEEKITRKYLKNETNRYIYDFQ